MDEPPWLLEAKLLGCPFPETDEALAALATRGVTLLINLHHERRTSPERLRRLGMVEVFLPVPDFQPPPPALLEAGIAALLDATDQGKRAAVHCGGGLGRTGTLLACYLLATEPGLSPDDAIGAVRAARPGSVETAGQEQAVREFAARRESPLPPPAVLPHAPPPAALPVPQRRRPPGREAGDNPRPRRPSPRR